MEPDREQLNNLDPSRDLTPVENWTFSPQRSSVARSALAALTVVALVGGGLLVRGGQNDPLRIRLGGTLATADAKTNTEGLSLPTAGYDFVLADGLTVSGGRQDVWRFDARPERMPSVVEAINTAGLDVGLYRNDSSNEWSSENGFLSLSDSGEWWFNAAPDKPVMSEPPCAPDNACTEIRATPDDTRTTGSTGMKDSSVDNSLSQQLHWRTEELAKRVHHGDLGPVKVSYSYEYGIGFAVPLLVAGKESGQQVTVSFDPRDGTLASASGFVGDFVKAGSERTVSLEEAVTRLGGFPIILPAAAEPAGATTPPGDGTVSSQPFTGTSEPAPAVCGQVAEPIVGDDTTSGGTPVPQVDCMPTPTPEPDGGPSLRMAVTLVKVERILVPLHDASGTLWLLPGYRFTDDNGGTWETQALSDDVFAGSASDPAPNDKGPGTPEPGVLVPGADKPALEDSDGVVAVTPDIAAAGAAEKVVGMREQDAVKTLGEQNLAVRIVVRDGEQFPATMDYRSDRVNLTVKNDKVVEATVG